MKIEGKNIKTISVFKNIMTIPDCWVINSNKIGAGNGEAKFYISSKKDMYDFYGDENFTATCFILKKDLIAYMEAIKNEYLQPSQEYRDKENLPKLWEERKEKISKLDEVIYFEIQDQKQILGNRGYINSKDKVYKLIREIALPLVSYIYSEKVVFDKQNLFYWKIFVDFEAILELKNGPLVFKYGKKGETEEIKTIKTDKKPKETKTREGQRKYRELLLEQTCYCPFTMISDERLLIASHIKPWVVCSDVEKIDPYNGYILSPLYDKLFDKGFITFTSNRHIILSEFISPNTWKKIGLKNDSFIKHLLMDDKRKKYLKFHHQSVFKGLYEDLEC